MASPADGLAAFLMTRADVVEQGKWTLRNWRLTDSPDRQIVLKDSGGRGAEPGLAIDYPNIQILVRGSSSTGGYIEAWNKMELVRDYLLGIPSPPPEAPEIVSITQRGGIQPLDPDDKTRPVLSLNFQLITEPVPAGPTNRE